MLGRGDDLLANPTLLLTGLKAYYIHLVLIVTPERGKEDTERRAPSEVMVSGKLEKGKSRDLPPPRSWSLGTPLETTPTRTLELGVGLLGVWEAVASSGSCDSEEPLAVWEAEASSDFWGSEEPLESLMKIY